MTASADNRSYLKHPEALSDHEAHLLRDLRAVGLPRPARQFAAIPGRRWRWDIAYPEARLLIEVDGGGHTYGRHSRAEGMDGDAEKQSTAVAAGWRCMRFTPKLIATGRAVELIETALRGRPADDDPPGVRFAAKPSRR